MRPTALAFSGAIASGKTVLSSRVAELLGWPRVAFGDYVRSVSTARGLPHTRRVLQDLGEKLITEQGWDGFCWSVLKLARWGPGQSIVIDGVRHAEAASTLRILVAPAEFLLVLVTVHTAVRESRLAERGGDEADSLAPVDSHSTEVQLLDRLPALVDFTVDGSLSPNDAARIVLEWVGARQAN